MPYDLLTVPEACDLTRWTKATLYTKVSRKQIPHVKLGRSIRFRRADLLKLFKDVPPRPTLRIPDAPANGEGKGILEIA